MTFRLPSNRRETPTAQRSWQFCGRCNALFWAGDRRDFGHCPSVNKYSHFHSSGGGAPDYLLYHDVVPKPGTQRDWRFCGKCRCLFYDGYPDKGRCAAGGGHQAQGWNFVLVAGRDPYAGHPIDPGTVLHPVNE